MVKVDRQIHLSYEQGSNGEAGSLTALPLCSPVILLFSMLFRNTNKHMWHVHIITDQYLIKYVHHLSLAKHASPASPDI